MTEVRVERLGAGHGQENGAERNETDHAVDVKEFHAVERIEGEQHPRIAGELRKSRDRGWR